MTVLRHRSVDTTCCSPFVTQLPSVFSVFHSLWLSSPVRIYSIYIIPTGPLKGSTSLNIMPRKAFISDLNEASSSFDRINVSKIKAGEDDGQVCFRYEHQGSFTEVVALVPGESDSICRAINLSSCGECRFVHVGNPHVRSKIAKASSRRTSWQNNIPCQDQESRLLFVHTG